MASLPSLPSSLPISPVADSADREARTRRLLEHARAAAVCMDPGRLAALDPVPINASADTLSALLFDQLRMQASKLSDACAGGMAVRAHVVAGSRSVVIRGGHSPPLGPQSIT
jgi:hypothetical protein